MARVRYNYGDQMVLLGRDLLEAVASEGITLHSVVDSRANYDLSNEIALIFYVTIWAAVVFFVFYAKS